jgi:hypothetical protein
VHSIKINEDKDELKKYYLREDILFFKNKLRIKNRKLIKAAF